MYRGRVNRSLDQAQLNLIIVLYDLNSWLLYILYENSREKTQQVLLHLTVVGQEHPRGIHVVFGFIIFLQRTKYSPLNGHRYHLYCMSQETVEIVEKMNCCTFQIGLTYSMGIH